MMSKNLFFKLMREDWKNRLWTPALITLVGFFVYPVYLAFLAGHAVRGWDTKEKALRWFSEQARSWLSFENQTAVVLVVIAAFVCGLGSFHYLTSKSKVDFYHSLPIRREKLFLVHYVDGILMMAIPSLFWLFISVIVCTANGADMAGLGGIAAKSYVLHMVYYVLCYTTIVIASMLTGHLVVSFFGSLVLMFYMPIAAGMFESFFNTFFLSYYYQDRNVLTETLMRISPIMEYAHTEALSMDQEPVTLQAFLAVAASLILAAAAVFLYKKRGSETAGRAMAFSASQPIIRILITVLSGLGMGDFLWSMQQSDGWMAFGIICGCVIAHCVIESIYHFDFRRLFSHKVQLAVSMLAACAILFTFRFDVFGYDTYLPNSGNVKYAAVDIVDLNSWVSYGKTKESEQADKKTMTYIYEDSGSTPYILEHMQCKDVDTVLNLAAAGIEANRSIRQRWNLSANGDAGEDSDRESSWYSTAVIRYTLKSGRMVNRTYTISAAKSYDLIRKLVADESYQKAAYPLLSADAGEFVGVRYRQNRLQGDQSLKNLTKEEILKLLDTYRDEFSSLTLDQMKDEVPMGLIRFTNESDEKAIAWWDQCEKQGYADENGWSYVYGTDVRDQDYYPVYPSFTKTIALLEQHQISLKDEHLSDKILSVTVGGYTQNSASYQEITFTDPAEIKALGDISQTERMLYYDPVYETESMIAVTVTLKDENGSTYNSFFKKGEIPKLVKERMGI